MSTDWGEVSKLLSEFFKDKFMKVAFRIAAFTIVFFLIFQIVAFIILTALGKPTKLLWSSNFVTVKVHDTINKTTFIHDTTFINKMKINSSASGLQNNAPNYGNQAGRDMNVTNNLKNIDFVTKTFIPETNQTTFLIPNAPTNVNKYIVSINGVSYSSKHFTVENGKLTLKVDFKIEKGDEVVIKWTK